MKKLVVAFTVLAAFTGSAVAADLAPRYSKAPPPPPVAVANWTGCYISGGGGYGLFSNDHDQIQSGPSLGGNFPLGTVTQANMTSGGRGWLGDVGGGCDYQFGGGGLLGNVVIGAFADYTFSDINGTYKTYGYNFNDGSAEIVRGNMKQSSSWAVGGRVGWVVVPQLMTYFNGGYTEAQFDGFSMSNSSAPFIGVASGLALPSQTYKGYFLGGGTEYAFAALPGLFLRSEYRYSTFDGKSTGLNCLGASGAGPQASCAGAGPSGWTERSTVHSQIIKTDLVYRFNWGGGGVFAKY